ncbi:DUF4374 domain-containing protein [Pedobacter antarcticus]|uniref:DUF4374 domain-containing protein n=1 Tax=Pedobacter antarcticus TaxID=34086 RepID=UPI000891039C|nr:DUF4374 domain-containing protein [Pedobacter antarcticus]SDL82350.1 protein of unknown function [Pedobacter antarcticus]
MPYLAWSVLRFPLLCLLVIGLFGSCKPPGNGNQPSDKHYSLYILGKDGVDYMLETNSLDKGTLKPEDDGIKLYGSVMDRDIIVHQGFYYHLNRKKPIFEKYKKQGKTLKTIASIPLEDFYIENFKWIDDQTLLLTGLSNKQALKVRYMLLNTAEMRVISAGFIPVEVPGSIYSAISVGIVEPKDKEVLIGYTFHRQTSASSYTTSDTTYMAVYTFPEMKLRKLTKDTRSTYPGGMNTIQPYSFYDEKKDYYLMTCPGIALGNRTELPTAIMRIKAGDTVLDPDYFFNISDSPIKNHAYGIWYLGNGKAIIRSERKDLFKGLNDHYSTPHFEFYILDLAKKTTTKLDLPLDKGTRKQCVIVQDDIAYIAVNSPKEGNYVWIYNIKDGSLKRGLQMSGQTDFILRIDKLQD